MRKLLATMALAIATTGAVAETPVTYMKNMDQLIAAYSNCEVAWHLSGEYKAPWLHMDILFIGETEDDMELTTLAVWMEDKATAHATRDGYVEAGPVACEKMVFGLGVAKETMRKMK